MIMRSLTRLSLLSSLLFLAGPARADSFASWSAKATKAERQGDEEAALGAWNNAIRLWRQTDGKKARAHAFEARAALHERAFSQELALKDLSAAVKLDEKNAKLFHRRGKLYLEQGRTSDALGDFYKATALNSSFAEAFFDRARAYERQGEAKFAGEDYRAACEMGFKKACPMVPARKSRKAPQAKKPAPKRRRPQSPAQAQPSPESMAACADSVTRCAEGRESSTYTACVAKAEICEDSPKKGCCPSECVRLFKKALNTKSEAQAFREIFTADNACAK